LSSSEPWKSRDRKVKKRRNIKNMNRDFLSPQSKKARKPRVSENRNSSDADFEEIFKM